MCGTQIKNMRGKQQRQKCNLCFKIRRKLKVEYWHSSFSRKQEKEEENYKKGKDGKKKTKTAHIFKYITIKINSYEMKFAY